jgi:diphosphomevalonate decarboxylase
MKATAIAPSNIAFIKYMGRKDDVLRLPENGSISMNLSNLLTTTTVEFSDQYKKDEVTIDGRHEEGESARVIKHLDRIRALATIKTNAKVVSANNFPAGTGLSSSASGFAALTLAGAAAAGLTLSEKSLSILARQGSGSSCRSIPDGFTEWHDGNTSEESFAESLFPPDHWDICDVVAVASSKRKEVPTSEAHGRVESGPYYQARIKTMQKKILQCKKILAEKDFAALGALCESEALDLHVIFMSAGIIYLRPESLAVMQAVQSWRPQLQAYFTVNTGQDVHVLCEAKDAVEVEKHLKALDFVKQTIVNTPAPGARLTEKHLF